jgi:hypothetical protein
VIPFVEVPGSVGAAAPLQIGGTAAKVGTTFGLTVTVSVADVAH